MFARLYFRECQLILILSLSTSPYMVAVKMMVKLLATYKSQKKTKREGGVKGHLIKSSTNQSPHTSGFISSTGGYPSF